MDSHKVAGAQNINKAMELIELGSSMYFGEIESKGEASRPKHEKAADQFRAVLLFEPSNMLALDWLAFLYKEHHIIPKASDFIDNHQPISALEQQTKLMDRRAQLLAHASPSERLALVEQISRRELKKLQNELAEQQKYAEKTQHYLTLVCTGRVLVENEDGKMTIRHYFKDKKTAEALQNWLRSLATPYSSALKKIKYSEAHSWPIPGRTEYQIVLNAEHYEMIAGPGSAALLLTTEELNNHCHQLANEIDLDELAEKGPVFARLLQFLEQDDFKLSIFNLRRFFLNYSVAGHFKEIAADFETHFPLFIKLLSLGKLLSENNTKEFIDVIREMSHEERMKVFSDYSAIMTISALPEADMRACYQFVTEEELFQQLAPVTNLLHYSGFMKVSKEKISKYASTILESIYEELQQKAKPIFQAISMKRLAELCVERPSLLKSVLALFDADYTFGLLRYLSEDQLKILIADVDLEDQEKILSYLVENANWRKQYPTANSDEMIGMFCLVPLLLDAYPLNVLLDFFKNYWLSGKDIPIEVCNHLDQMRRQGYFDDSLPLDVDVDLLRAMFTENDPDQTAKWLLPSELSPQTIFKEGISWAGIRRINGEEKIDNDVRMTAKFLQFTGSVKEGVKAHFNYFKAIMPLLNGDWDSLAEEVSFSSLKASLERKQHLMDFMQHVAEKKDWHKVSFFRRRDEKTTSVPAEVKKITMKIEATLTHENILLNQDASNEDKLWEYTRLWKNCFRELRSEIATLQIRKDIAKDTIGFCNDAKEKDFPDSPKSKNRM